MGLEPSVANHLWIKSYMSNQLSYSTIFILSCKFELMNESYTWFEQLFVEISLSSMSNQLCKPLLEEKYTKWINIELS